MNRHEKPGGVATIVVTLFVLIFVAIFIGFGGWFLYSDWRVNTEFLPVEATIITSEVGVNSDRDGSTYYPDITFSYEVNGNIHTTGQYDIHSVSSTGRAGKQKTVQRFPVGSKHEGWYDPDNPSVAVLNREYSLMGFVFGGVGIVIPLIAIVVMVTRAGRAKSRRAIFHDMGIIAPGPILSQVRTKGMEMLSDGRVRLRGAGTRKGVLGGIVLLLVAAFWNSITWVLVFVMWSEEGGMGWGNLAFISIFVLIGLGLLVAGIWAIVRAVLVGGRISPPILTIDRLPLRLGEKFEVAYDQQARKQCEINRVTVTLTCKEWVQYTVGTNTRTAEHTVSEREEVIAESAQVLAGGQIGGTAEFDIPADAMQSFDAANNKIKWFLKVHTDIARWPDYSDDIAIAVSPRIVEERA